MRFERREHRPLALIIVTPLLAVAAALALSGILIAAAGAPVLEAYWRILVGAFGSRLSATETLTRATPLMLTGLAAAVAFRARVWNIGGEGQFYFGAIAVAAVGSKLLGNAPGYLSIPLLLITGAFAGMILLIIPLWLRLRFSVDEVVTSLLLNFVAVLVVSMLIDGPLKDPLAFGWPQSQSVPDVAMLPKLVFRSRLHWGFGIALILAFVVHFVQSRTVFGLKSRAAGLSPEGAVFAGVPLARTLLLVACVSGGLAGLAGAVEVMGVKGYVTTDLSPGFGYSGIVVAMLAGLHPLGVVLAALFTATMFVGADGMSRALKIPSYIADVTVALSLITMLVAVFFAQYRIRR
ncbi:ABC transporter permease [Pleomorphomonas sp. PLEO]|uniref:ABC transporter permease n=1 Tax=Pleomorphomonas sp. PLEO TaxID=3239306 RepID=UPI00351F1336